MVRGHITQKRVRELFDYREDGALIWKVQNSNCIHPGDVAGFKGSRYYLEIGADGKTYKAHRLVFLFHHGYLPKGIDRRDTNTLNNRIENLRPANQAQNSANRKSQKNRRFKGVCLVKARAHLKTPWKAQIKSKGITKYLGYFATQKQAAKAYDKEAPILFGEFARLNFPKEHRA